MEQRGEKLLASQERKAAAISELAAALKEDHEGWEAEREVWAKEKAAVEARLSGEERQVAKLKQEVKRLGRGVHAGKQDKERLARESEGLRQENRKLTARNEKLEARNLEVRRQIDTLVERNKRLQATMARELLSNSNNGGGDDQAAARTQTEASGSGSGQAEVVANIVLPSDDRPSVSDAVGQGGSSRRPRRDQCSDADEVTTPKDTTTAGRGGPPVGRGHSKAKRGDGAAWGWPVPSGATEPAHSERQGVGAKRRPRRGSVDSFNSDPKENTGVEVGAEARARTEAVDGRGVSKSERLTANTRGGFGGHNGGGGGGHGSSRAPFAVARPGPASKDCSIAANLVKKRPRPLHSSSSRSNSSSSTGSSSSSSSHGGGGTSNGGSRAQQEGDSVSLGRVPPVSSVHQAIAPAVSDKRMPTTARLSSSSSSSAAVSKPPNAPLERKRARLSLGPEDRRPAGGGSGVEITEVLEQRRARGARSARSNVNPSHEPPRQIRSNSPALAKEGEDETKVVRAVKADGDNGGLGQPRDIASSTGGGAGVGIGIGTGAGVGTKVGAGARAKNVPRVIRSLLEAVPMTGKEEARLGLGDDPPSPPTGRRVSDERPGLNQVAAEQQRGQGRRGSDEQPPGMSGRDVKGNAAVNPPMHTFDQRSERSGFDDPGRIFRENSRRGDEPRRPSNVEKMAYTREMTDKRGGTEQGGRGGDGGGGGGAGWENAVLAARVTGPAAMPEAIYPQLAMATVKSPKKSKPSRRRQQHQWQDQRQSPEQDQHQYPERDQDQDQNQQFHSAGSRPVAAGGASGYPWARGSEEEEEEEVHADRSEGVWRRSGSAVEGARLNGAKPPRHHVPVPSERTSRVGEGGGEGPRRRQGDRIGVGAVDNSSRVRDGGGGCDGFENCRNEKGIKGRNGGGGGGGGDGVGEDESRQPADGGGKGNANPRGSAEAPTAALLAGGAGEGGGGPSGERGMAATGQRQGEENQYREEKGGEGEDGEGGEGRRIGGAGGASERRGMTVAAARRQGVDNPYRQGNGREGGGGRGGGGGGEAGGREGVRGGGRYEQRSPKKYKYQEVVRDRFKRAAMKGHDCEHCEAYLAAVGGSPGERQAMLNMCSRHKHTEANGPPAETPDGFWDLSFADSVSSNKELEVLGRRRNGGGGGGGARQLAGGDSPLDF